MQDTSLPNLPSDLVTKYTNEANALKNQKAILEQQFHQVTGAIAMCEKLIQDEMLKCKAQTDKELALDEQGEQENGETNSEEPEQAP